MPAPTPPEPAAIPHVFAWRRLKYPLGVCLFFNLMLAPGWKVSYSVLSFRLFFIGLSAVLAFGVIERWPARLPAWLARWALQVAGVALVIPLAAAIAYTVTTIGLHPSWWRDGDRLGGFFAMSAFGVLIAPWMAISALLRQIKDEARNLALAFELERSELERNALDSRLRLLQAQVEPHFLFNTLANVRELVDSGSPQASSVLASLIAYLRAAVPRLQGPATTLAQEIELVRAYLEVMHMRMPDRLQFVLSIDDKTLPLQCPPMTLLTLVENAVRHGIDPSEEGGRIEVRTRLQNGRCRADVIDTGVGLGASTDGLGTGLANLRERLQLAFAGDAQLRISPLQPHGVCAELEFPARPGNA